jgi:hypothetical protein
MIIWMGRPAILVRRILLQFRRYDLDRLLDLRVTPARHAGGSHSTSKSGGTPWFFTFAAEVVEGVKFYPSIST